jgi:ATP synthase F1 gamma subunit
VQLNELRKELRFTKELLSLVETLKNVAGSQYHLMEKEKERFDRFMDAFSGFFHVVNLVEVENPLVRRMSDVTGVIIVTSDSGFMGGLNQGVIRAALAAQGNATDDKIALVVIGEKGANVFVDQRRPFKAFRGIHQDSVYEQAVEVKNYIVGEVLAKRMGRVLVAYPRPLSFSAQTIEVVHILPCGELFDEEAETEVSHRTLGRKIIADARKVIVESSFSDMVEYLSSVWVTSRLFEVFEDSKLAEFGARAMHLEGSHQKVEKTYKTVRHLCFKATHERTDKGMRESFSARGAQKKRKRRTENATSENAA